MKEAQPIDSQANSQDAISTWKPWIVCLSAALYFFYEFMQATAFNAINAPLSHTFGLSASEVSNISSAFFYAEILFLFPAGILLDHFSTKRLILIAMATSVICTYLFATAQHVWVLTACRFVTGLAGGFTMLACVRIASRWFPSHKMALAIGVITFMPMLGATLSQTPLVYLINHVGWRAGLQYDAAFGLFLWFIIRAAVEDFPKNNQKEKQREENLIHSLSILSTIKKVLRNKQNWCAGIYASAMNLPIFILGSLWGQRYLVQNYHLSNIQSSWANSLIFIGMMVGCPLLGKLSDKLRNRKQPMVICGVLLLLALLITFYIPNLPFVVVLCLFFLTGFSSAGQIICYPLIAESNDLALTGTAEGIAATLIMGAGIIQQLVGVLLGQQAHLNFMLGFSVMPIFLLLGFICIAQVKETKAKSIAGALT